MVRKTQATLSAGKDFTAAGSVDIDVADLTPEDIARMAPDQRDKVLEQAIAEIRILREKVLMSSFDKLSGLRNREHFDEAGDAMFKQAQKEGSLTVIVLDINGLKKINDGEKDHSAGDTLIAAAAARIEHVFRHSDIVARIGGDEFGILVPNGSVADITARLDALQNRILIPLPDGREIDASFSYGTSTYEGQKKFTTMVKEADKNMYDQKQERKAKDITTKIINGPRTITNRPEDYIGLAAVPMPSSFPQP